MAGSQTKLSYLSDRESINALGNENQVTRGVKNSQGISLKCGQSEQSAIADICMSGNDLSPPGYDSNNYFEFVRWVFQN